MKDWREYIPIWILPLYVVVVFALGWFVPDQAARESFQKKLAICKLTCSPYDGSIHEKHGCVCHMEKGRLVNEPKSIGG